MICAGVGMRKTTEIEQCRVRRQSTFYLKADIDVPDAVLTTMARDNERAIAERVPAIATLCIGLFGRSPNSVAPLPEQGTFHCLYRVTYGGGKTYIIRTNAPASPYPALDLHIDGWAMARLRGADLPAVPVYALDTTRKIVPFDYAVMDEAGGKPLSRLLENAGNAHLVSELGRVVAGLHGIKCNGFGLLDVESVLSGEARGTVASWTDYLGLNLDAHLKTCADTGALSAHDARLAESAFNQADLDCVRPSLLHGDLNHRNVYSDGRVITAVIDWEDCLSGDPVFDIASWGTFIGNDERLEQFLEGYRSVRCLPDDFERRYWLYYLRIVLAKTVHRYRFGYYLKDRIPAAKRLEKPLKMVGRLVGG